MTKKICKLDAAKNVWPVLPVQKHDDDDDNDS